MLLLNALIKIASANFWLDFIVSESLTISFSLILYWHSPETYKVIYVLWKQGKQSDYENKGLKINLRERRTQLCWNGGMGDILWGREWFLSSCSSHILESSCINSYETMMQEKWANIVIHEGIYHTEIIPVAFFWPHFIVYYLMNSASSEWNQIL